MYNFNIFNNSFNGFYVSDFNEVLNMACSTDGTPTIFVNLDQNLLWSKKLINNKSYIQSYKIIPINNEPEPAQSTTDQKLDKLIELLTRRELNEPTVSNEHASEQIKTAKS